MSLKKNIKLVSFDDIVNATVISVFTGTMGTTFEINIKASVGFNHKVKIRTRKRVEIIFRDMGPRFMRETYRMSQAFFWKVLDLRKINENLYFWRILLAKIRTLQISLSFSSFMILQLQVPVYTSSEIYNNIYF